MCGSFLELVDGGAAGQPPTVRSGPLERRGWHLLARVVEADLEVVWGEQHRLDFRGGQARLTTSIGECAQREVEEAGGVRLLHCAERDLDISCGAGRQVDPPPGPARSLLATSQPGQQCDDAHGEQAGADEPGDDPQQLSMLVAIG